MLLHAEETNQRLKAKIEKIKEDVANLSEQVGVGYSQAWLCWLVGGSRRGRTLQHLHTAECTASFL